MTTNPDDPQPTDGSTPPPPSGGSTPPPPAGGSTPPPPPGGSTPPAGGYQSPPPAGGYQGAPAGGYGQAAPPPAYGAQPPLSDSDQRMWAMLSHLGGIILGFIAPLVVWLVFRERGRYVDEQAKESLNFQITMVIAWVAILVLTVVTFGVAGFLYFVLWLVILVFCIIAGLAANKGEPYRYPVNIRFIK